MYAIIEVIGAEGVAAGVLKELGRKLELCTGLDLCRSCVHNGYLGRRMDKMRVEGSSGNDGLEAVQPRSTAS